MWYQSQYQRALRRAFPLLQEVEEKDRSEGFTGKGMGGSGLASSKDWQGMPLVFPMIFHGNKTYWETLKFPWVVSKYGSGKQDAPARPRCSAGTAGLCGSQPSTCPGLSRPEQGRHQTNSWVILMVMRGFMIGYGWLLLFCWGGAG